MTRYARVILAAGFFVGSMQLSAEQAISIRVRPAVATWKGSARVSVLVARNELNRVLIWEVDGPSYYRSSTMELNGAASPRSYFFTISNLPEGDFEVRATVRRSDDSLAIDRSSIKVVGGPPAW
jgi:hypothetical protein